MLKHQAYDFAMSMDACLQQSSVTTIIQPVYAARRQVSVSNLSMEVLSIVLTLLRVEIQKAPHFVMVGVVMERMVHARGQTVGFAAGLALSEVNFFLSTGCLSQDYDSI